MDDQSGHGANPARLRAGWYAVALSRDLKAKPHRLVFNGQAYAVWRSRDGLHAVLDLCPHRGAPLSMGRIIEGRIACPYHGWRFDGRGTCTHMPALDGAPPAAHILALAAAEGDGLVFLWWPGASRQLPPTSLPVTPLMTSSSSVIMTGEVTTTLADFAENILDTTHTSVVHAGYLRGSEDRRHIVPAIVTGADWIEARYPPAATPDGFMSRFMGTRGYHITDRFRPPNLTEVEYRQGDALKFAVRFHLTPTDSGRIRAFAIMSVIGTSMVARAQIWLLKHLFRRIIAEDRVILTAVAANRAAFGRSPLYIAPQDLLRAGIDALLRGEMPVAAPTAPVIRV